MIRQDSLADHFRLIWRDVVEKVCYLSEGIHTRPTSEAHPMVRIRPAAHFVNPTVFDILDGRLRNSHVRIGAVYLYARRSRRWIDGAMVEAFDVATIEVQPKRLQGRGHGAKFFDFIEAEAASRGLIVFVESILNERLYAYLQRRGYVPAQS